MNATREKEPHEVQLALPPRRVWFFGCVESATNEELLASRIEGDEPVETSLVGNLHLEIQKDGRWENIETGEGGEIEPGQYVLTSKGLFSVPDNEAVFN